MICATVKAYKNFDYYPFGMMMPGRNFSAGTDYRYGFNGKEKDKSTGEGNLDFGARVLDVRLGRWLSIDLKQAKYPFYTPYNFVGNNPLNAIDPDGKDIIFLIAVAGAKETSSNNMFLKSAETRKKDIESSKGFNPKSDQVVILQVQDLSSIKGMVNERVKELSPKYGKTREVGIYSHNGEHDGPIGKSGPLDENDPSFNCTIDGLQMKPECWGQIDWNWKDGGNNTFTLFGCNAAKNSDGYVDNFALHISVQPNMKDVSVKGLEVSSFPSIYTDKRVSTTEMDKGDFSKVENLYMVGSDGGFGDFFFNEAYLFSVYKNGEVQEQQAQEGAKAPENTTHVIK